MVIKFLDLENGHLFEVGIYSRLGANIKCSSFSASVVYLFCNKTINGNNKMWRYTKQGFCKILHLQGSLFLVFIQNFSGWEGEGHGVGVGTYFEPGHLRTFSAFRMGDYSWWALIRGWALIWINIYSTPTNLSYVLICIKEMESLNPIMSLSQGTLSNSNNSSNENDMYKSNWFTL